MAGFTFSYTGIRVRDLERSIQFYTGVLGMRLVWRMKIPRQRGEVAVLQSPRGRQKLELNSYAPGSKYATPYVRGEGLDHLAFHCADHGAAIRAFKRKGIPIVDRYIGKRGRGWFYIEDPDGNWIEID